MSQVWRPCKAIIALHMVCAAGKTRRAGSRRDPQQNRSHRVPVAHLGHNIARGELVHKPPPRLPAQQDAAHPPQLLRRQELHASRGGGGPKVGLPMRLGRAAPLHHAPLPVTDPSRIAAALQRRRAAAGRVCMQAGSVHAGRQRPCAQQAQQLSAPWTCSRGHWGPQSRWGAPAPAPHQLGMRLHAVEARRG